MFSCFLIYSLFFLDWQQNPDDDFNNQGEGEGTGVRDLGNAGLEYVLVCFCFAISTFDINYLSLVPIVWQGIELKPVQKDFYEEHEEVAKLTEEEIKEWREVCPSCTKL